MTLYLALLTSLWLGILTSISPCPLATNIAAVSFISKKFDGKLPILLNGILYTLGRTVTYFALSLLIVTGLFSIPSISAALQIYIAKILGPILILVGMFFLDLLPLPAFGRACGHIHTRLSDKGYLGSFLLGIVFALAICPSSAAIFFGALIPMALEKRSNIAIPVLYGIGTGIPVAVFATLMAFSFKGIGRLFDNLAKFEIVIRRVTGVLFIVIGIYYVLTHIFGIF